MVPRAALAALCLVACGGGPRPPAATPIAPAPAAPPVEPAPDAAIAAPAAPAPVTSAPPTDTADDAYDGKVKLDRLTDHPLGFRYLALPGVPAGPGVPADRVVVFDTPGAASGDLPSRVRYVVMLTSPDDDALVPGAPAGAVTAAVKKYSTVRGLTFTSIGLEALPCRGAHHPQASCYEGTGEFLRPRGMTGSSRSGRVRAHLVQRGARRALVFAFGDRNNDVFVNFWAATAVLAAP